jgi:hypothetical protein
MPYTHYTHTTHTPHTHHPPVQLEFSLALSRSLHTPYTQVHHTHIHTTHTYTPHAHTSTHPTDAKNTGNQVSRDADGTFWVITHVLLTHIQPARNVSRKSSIAFMRVYANVAKFVPTGAQRPDRPNIHTHTHTHTHKHTHNAHTTNTQPPKPRELVPIRP